MQAISRQKHRTPGISIGIGDLVRTFIILIELTDLRHQGALSSAV